MSLSTEDKPLDEVCTLLQHNDSSLETISFSRSGSSHHWPIGFAHPLAKALLNNTTVSLVELVMEDILCGVTSLPQALNEAEPLLLYLATSTTLRRVKLTPLPYPFHAYWLEFAGHLVASMAQNQYVESLDCGALFSYNGRLVEAFRSNATLKSLRLQLGGFLYPPNAVESVLPMLVVNATLESLVLEGSFWNRLPRSLSTLLQSTTSKLCCLGLYMFKIDNDFLKAMASNSTIGRLSMSHCLVELGAIDFLNEILDPRGNSNAIGRELDLRYCNLEGRQDDRKIVANWWTRPPPQRQAQGHPLRLVSLVDDDVNQDEFMEILTCLAHSTHFRELTLTVKAKPACQVTLFHNRILRALRTNGSLQSVNVTTYGPEGANTIPFFDEAQSRLVQAYCDRNRLSPQLVSSLPPDNLDRLPLLFAVVQPAGLMAPNALLAGLLCSAAAGISIGPSVAAPQRLGTNMVPMDRP